MIRAFLHRVSAPAPPDAPLIVAYRAALEGLVTEWEEGR